MDRDPADITVDLASDWRGVKVDITYTFRIGSELKAPHTDRRPVPVSIG
jgi:hypothetical protein